MVDEKVWVLFGTPWFSGFPDAESAKHSWVAFGGWYRVKGKEHTVSKNQYGEQQTA
jgi:hypothetical protein